MAIKKTSSMLPPKRATKRAFGVNVRFTQAEHDVLQEVATYRNTTITELVYHVVAQVALAQLVNEMNEEQAAESAPVPTPTVTAPSVQASVLSPTVIVPKAAEVTRLT